MMFTVATETIERFGSVNTALLEPADEPYAIIPLHGKYGQGKVAKVSLEDVARVRRYRWYCSDRGYVYAYLPITYPRRTFKRLAMHRFILDAPDGVLVDHKKFDKLDNRRSKIRLATHVQNSRNVDRRGKRAKGCRGQYIGTRPHRKRWRAMIKLEGENKDLGSFFTEEEAAQAYDACCRYHYGDFAVCNFEGDEAYSVDEARGRARSRIATQSSKYIGVRWFASAQKWHVVVTHNGISHSLGHYEDEVEAAKAYDACGRYFFGASAPTNFPKGDCLSPNELHYQYLRNHFNAGKRTSAYEGVYQSGTRWRSAIVIDGRQTKVGAFSTEEEAAKAYDACVRFYYPVGSFTNFDGDELTTGTKD